MRILTWFSWLCIGSIVGLVGTPVLHGTINIADFLVTSPTVRFLTETVPWRTGELRMLSGMNVIKVRR